MMDISEKMGFSLIVMSMMTKSSQIFKLVSPDFLKYWIVILKKLEILNFDNVFIINWTR